MGKLNACVACPAVQAPKKGGQSATVQPEMACLETKRLFSLSLS